MNWIPVSDEMPTQHVDVIAHYINSHGNHRRVRAMFVPKNTWEDDGDFGEYNEDADCFYLPEGWYEHNEHDETMWFISEAVTHWMPLPPLPV